MRKPWNKRDARKAVEVREQLRIERAESFESRRGERLQISVHRFMGRVQTSDGQSARQFCRGLEQLITKAALPHV